MKKSAFFILLFSIVGLALSAQEYQLSKPVIKVIDGGALFEKKAKVILDFRLEGSELRYTLDGSEPNTSSPLYTKPILIKASNRINAKAFKEGFLPSETVSLELMKLGQQIESVEISPAPSTSYPGNGGQTLLDRKAGSTNFRDGHWLGYDSGPVTLTIDLGKLSKVDRVVLSTLSSSGSWIMPPTQIEASFSQDGTAFKYNQELNIKSLTGHEPGAKHYYSLKNESGKVRYIKLVVHPLAKLPDWHAGKGNPAWLFLDEVIIN